MALHLAHSVAAVPGDTGVRDAATFDVLDDVVRQPSSQGVLSVRVQATDDLGAVIGHLERRAEQARREVVVVSSSGVESSFRDAAQRLGLRAIPHDAVEAAQAIAEEASRRNLLMAVPLVGGPGGAQISQWDLSVAAALSRAEIQALVVLISPREFEVSAELEALSFSVGRQLKAEEARRWWDAFSESARERAQAIGLAGLERWARRGMASALLSGAEDERQAVTELSDSAAQLLARIRLAHRAWPERQLAALGPAEALAELLAAGRVELRDGLICSVSGAGTELLPEHDDRVCVAQALQRVFPADAWAFVRAAELLAQAARGDAAEAAMRRALRMAADASSRCVLWERWRKALEGLDEAQRSSLGIRGAELALELGDVDIALVWAERASGVKPRPESALVLGRAALARGDLVSAEAALGRARDLGAGSDVREAAIAELAEVAYSSGDMLRAQTFALEVLDSQKASVRLSARNLLGKLLLARAEWDEADAHFAADACEAAFCGERVAELRARINRAIALLSRGSPDEARPILLDVLSSAEQAGEVRAMGFALSNLAVLAIERHDYAQALDLSERAISVFRKLGERLGFARDVTNLVELRLRLGLVDAAEQALTFGRQALGPGAPASRLTELGLAAARVNLARGRTLEAERELRTAMRSATLSSDGDKLCECHRLAVRVALEEGVVLRAEADLARAESLSNNPFSSAEVGILRGLVQRAAGKPDLEQCLEAVLAARETGDEELAREAHVLVAEIALNRGDEGLATEHIRAAVSLRDDVAENLGSAYREVYLARPDLRGLAQLEVMLIEPGSDPRPTPSTRPSWSRAVARREREYIGRHPSVKKLLSTVARVGGTDSTVLIHGESGSGKELIAEGLHLASHRRSGPLVKVNCGALVETLLLSELFGHEKGAFTGANSRKRGRFERAHGGTLFLDEIGDISHRTQVALLRALEEGSIERVGGSAPISVDVRIVCASHRDLKRLVERGEFREDLYYRLSGITLQVPALRDRLSDLPALCGALLDSIARERDEAPKQVDAAALDLLAQHRWPGNVRELENALRVASLFAESNQIRCEDFTQHVEALARVAEAQPSAPASVSLPPVSQTEFTQTGLSQPGLPAGLGQLGADQAGDALEGDDVAGGAYNQIRDQGVSLSDLKRQIERECIARALDETGGNITRAAGVLGMKRPRLSQLVKQYGLTTSQQDPSADDASSPSATGSEDES